MLRSLLLLCLLLILPVQAAKQPQGIISEIEISGNRLLADQEIIDQIKSYVGMRFSKELVIEDLKAIYTMGYFVPQSVEAKPYQKPDGTILLEYSVQENPIVTDIVIYGADQIKHLDPYKHFAPLIAKPENARKLSELIHSLEQQYVQAGYIVARVKDIDIDSSGLLKIYIDEGIINSIKFAGNQKTKTEYLELLTRKTQIGKPYNEQEFAKDFKRIQGTSYFDDIRRSVRPSLDGDGYDLELQVREKEKFSSLGFGGGINSSAGLFGNLNYSRGNIRGKGETLDVNALIGSGFAAGSTLNTNSNFVRRGRYTSISAAYNSPYYHGHDYSLSRRISYSNGPNFTVDLSRQTLMTTAASISKRIGNGQSLSIGGSANYIDIEDRDRADYLDQVTDNILELYPISDKDVLSANRKGFLGGKRAIAKQEARQIRNEQIVSGMFLDFRTAYTYRDLDDRTKPRKGTRFRAAVVPVMGFGDVNSYTKLSTSATRFFPMPWRSTLLLNLRGGYELLGNMPQFAKLRLGTSSGVRGYRPISELGVGSKLLISTAEFRTPIYNIIPNLKNNKLVKNLDFALFADAGVIGGDRRLNRLTDRLSQAASVGFGLRVNIPLFGSLRFDIGFPLIDALTDTDRLFRLNFGPGSFI
ncbi:MAG: BamA/TamA family outer membrane protein [Candidatus Melainabacteria bacterium]|nr:BamA/TamA family outer membrane protein [Candidatus Melainabacteria bacterium]